MLKIIDRNINLYEKKVLFRADFDVPVSSEGIISEIFRIEKQKYMLDWLLEKGAFVILAAHSTKVKSFFEIMPSLNAALGKNFNLLNRIEDVAPYLLSYKSPAILDNLRLNEGEELNDPEFSGKLAKGFDLFINNDFAVCHREHASVSGITSFLPSFAGFLLEEELAQLEQIVSASPEGKVLILGGAKTATKIPALKFLLNKVEKILVGGVVANDFYKLKGHDIGKGISDDNLSDIFSGLDYDSNKILLPVDFDPTDNRFLDIGPLTVESFGSVIRNAKMVVWNGPMGMFEDRRFIFGTESIARAIVDSGAVKILGGGDTIAAVDGLGLLESFDFVSTGGGAMLAFLSGQELPGLKALGYYE